jgi:uncharacterized protein (TIGR02284 family)
MAVETKLALSEETINALQDLIRGNLDSHHGFNEAADRVDDPSLGRMFRRLAAERAAQSAELETLVEYQGRAPQRSGSTGAALHRLWIDLRAMVTGGAAHALLSEAERGEGYLMQMYEEAIRDTAGSAVNDILQRHYAAVKAAHDMVREMREARESRE